MSASDNQVGVGDVPLSPVMGPVSTGAEPVAQVGTESGSSHLMLGSVFCFAVPSVCETPCNDGYCPVNSVARLGTHAVDPA